MVKKSSQSKKDLELFERLCTFFLTLSNSENVLQCIKEVLTLDPNFNPFPLFNYLARGGTSISKKQLVDFMVDNSLSPSDQEVRCLLSSYGCKDKLSYSEFLNYIFPYNTQVIREISTVQIKKYPKTEKAAVTQEILCCFVMLLEEELQLIKKLEVQKRDNALRISRDKLKKVFKAIKKVSQKQANHTVNSENVITHLELRTFIRSFKKVEDHQFLNLGRRLSMGRQGIIGIEELEFWIKPWKKEKRVGADDDYNKLVEEREADPLLNRSSAKPDETKQNLYENYKNTLYGELKQNVEHFEPVRNREDEPESDDQNFLQFVRVYLKYEKSLEHLRSILSIKDDVDTMKLFKRFDKNARGVINAEDLQRGYQQLGGSVSNYDFNLLVQRHSAEAGILSYSEFCDIFKTNEDNRRQQKRLVSGSEMSHESTRLIVQILQTNLQAETQLRSIMSRMSQSEAKQLFSLINSERNGFISYQQLKNYLSNYYINPSMSELMAILKRFDRNKNGVILEDEFVNVLSAH